MEKFFYDWSLVIVALVCVLTIDGMPPGLGTLMFMVAFADSRSERRDREKEA